MYSAPHQSQRLLSRAKHLLQEGQQHLAQEILIDAMRDGSESTREEASRLFQEHFAPS
jgi:hypothetical protein